MADTYFFIHVPKTGGRSFEALLANIFPAAVTCPSYFEEQCVSPEVDLTGHRFYRGHHSYFLTTALPAGTKVLTFLRHPLARAMSTYEHIRRDQAHYHHQLLMEGGQTLAKFARHPTLGQHISNGQTRILGRSLDFPHLRRTAAFRPEEFPSRAAIFLNVLRSFGATAEELARAKERLKTMFFFGLTERFDESCLRFLRLLGRPAEPVPKINLTSPEVAGCRDQYSAEDLAAVTEANTLDLELYAYALGLFDSAGRPAAGSPPQ